MEDKKANIQTVSLSSYVRPTVREEQGKEYVTFGRANEHWDYILDRYYGSPTSAALISSFAERIYGRGS